MNHSDNIHLQSRGLPPRSLSEMESRGLQADVQEFDLRSVLGVLRRQARLLILTVVLLVAAAGGALLVLPPVYTAATLILVDPSQKDLLNPDSASRASSSDSARVESEVELVRSPTTLLRAIREYNLIEDEEFGVRIGLLDRLLSTFRLAEPELPTGEAALGSVMRNLRDALTVQRLGLTYLISVEVSSLDPQRAARVANAVAQAYIAQQLDAKIRGVLASRDIIQNRIAEANSTLVASEGAFDSFIDTSIESVTSGGQRTDLLNLKQRLDRISSSQASALVTSDVAARALQQQDWTSVAEQLQSDALAKLARDRQNLTSALASVEGEALDSLQAEIRRLEAELDAAAAAELTTLQQSIASQQEEIGELRSQLRRSVLQSDLPPTVLATIYELQQNAEIARTQYQSLLARQQDLNTQASLQVADSHIASEAIAPIEPSFPNPRLILMLAAAAALGIGIGLAFLVENYIGGFTSEEQLSALLRTRVTNAVPRQRMARKSANGLEISTLADYVSNSPLSVFAESIRRIQVGVDQMLRRHNPPKRKRGVVVMVGSAAPNEGKTTLALSLARSYALSGRSTLLIDCDLRKPSIHKLLGLEPSDGLLDYLEKPTEGPSLNAIVGVDEASGAQIVVGARRSDIATDQLVSGSTFTGLIDAARDSFDVIVLDTPPLGPVVDGLYLASFADVILLVVRWASTSQRAAKSAYAALLEAKRGETEIVAVLNQQQESSKSYKSKYAEYYHEA